MMAVLGIVISMLLLPGQSFGGTSTDYDNLYNTILTGYNKDGRPVLDQGTAINVTISFTLITIANLDEVTSEMITVGSFTIAWKDEKLRWTPSSHGNTLTLNIDESVVWKPSMTFLNPMSTNVGLLGMKQSRIKYFEDGSAYWMIADRYQTTCDFDTRYFPFDEQTCDMRVMAWDYSTQEVLMYPEKTTVDLNHFSENGAWELVSTETRTETLSTFSVVVFSLKLKRRAMFFVTNLLIPVFTILMLNTLVFILPSDSGERVGYSITCLLALAVFLTYVSEGLPQVSKPMPVMGYVLTVYLLISALICVETIFILRLHHKDENEEVSPFFTKIYNILTCSTCKKRSGAVETSSSQIDLDKVMEFNDEKKPEPLPLTWKKLSSRLDKICFISNLSVVIFVAVIFFLLVTVKL